MQTPSTATSSDLLIHLGVYTESRLAVDPRTEALAPLLRAKVEALQTSSAARVAARQELTRLEARADAAERKLDLATKGFADGLFQDVGRGREHPRYRALFPAGVLPYTQPRRLDQVAATEKLLRLCDANATDPVVIARRPEIEATLTTLVEALKPVTEALLALEKARTVEYQARATFVATYASTYHQAIVALGVKAEAEEAFLRFRSEKAATDDATDPDVAPNPA